MALIAIVVPLMTACGDLEKPKSEPYYAAHTPPRQQVFRWSNGKFPKSIDPANAAAAPETDLVRALYEGLTEIDPQTLRERPAVAERWESSPDLRTWTFTLRNDARWSNGERVTAADFVRSWKRLRDLRDQVAHNYLLANFVGFNGARKEASFAEADLERDVPPVNAPVMRGSGGSNSNTATIPSARFGAEAVGETILRVNLIAPDRDLPKLVANPIFRPVFGDGRELKTTPVSPATITNGAFRLVSAASGVISLERAETYWNRNNVKLERVQMFAAENSEQALARYRAGEIDAVTNAEFEPLALKLFQPYEDFRRWTHAAVNFYEVNHDKPPFDDRRVREALAIAIEREGLTEGELEGTTRPALSFLPFGRTDVKLVQDKERARELLSEAGYPDGEGFPVIRLVVNRNDTQQRVARAVARMWKQALDVETEIVIKDLAELESARATGDYDLIRRNVVFPAVDELMGILAILQPPQDAEAAGSDGVNNSQPAVEARPGSEPDIAPGRAPADRVDLSVTEETAVYELWAIPLYYPTSYSLVKPYVAGFEMNSLDAPLLTDVSINSDWQPK